MPKIYRERYEKSHLYVTMNPPPHPAVCVNNYVFDGK